MHELSICTSLAAIVTEHAAGRDVARVHLDVGHLRQVVPETLRYSWEVVTTDPPLAGSELVINHIPATLDCRSCGARTTIEFPVFRCSSCGSTDTEVTSGQELLVTSLDLVDPPGGAGRDDATASTPTRS
ncbi:MAG: hydrogenase maturation nickel metallochaperone HypA [Actinomycetota bacterium]